MTEGTSVRSPSDAEVIRELPGGVVIGTPGSHDSLVWRAIPYAEPPVGPLRWRAPRPPRSWRGIRDARTRTPSAPQAIAFSDRPPGKAVESDIIGSEDCLYLTVWSPRSSAPPGGRPVIVWLHGGGNVAGDGGDIDASRLAGTQDVVVVCVTHRLGIFGWFAHGSLAGTDGTDEDRSGNFATLDQIAALRWVRDSIAAFGGDPERVSIFGQSSGGWNVRALLSSPSAKGLFHRAAIQSVGGYQLMSFAHGENFVDDDPPGHPQSANELLRSLRMTDGLGISAEDARNALLAEAPEAIAQDLRGRSVAALFGAQRSARRRNAHVVSSEAQASRVSRVPPLLFQDGVVVSDTVQSHVPIIVGATRDEDRAFMSTNPAYVINLFGAPLIRDPARYSRTVASLAKVFWASAVHDAAEMFTAAGLPVWAYRFDWDDVLSPPGTNLRDLLGACHGIELPFLFGTLDQTRDVVAMRHLFDAESPDFRELSAIMMTYWAAFARSGDPSTGPSRVRWPPWDGSGFLVLDGEAGGGVHAMAGSQGTESCLAGLSDEFSGLTRETREGLVDDIRRYPSSRLTALQLDTLSL